MRMIKLIIKILIHIISLFFFIFGLIILHEINNSFIFHIYNFFSIPVNQNNFFDLGLLFVSIGFFLEFILTFKPIKVIVD